MPVYMRHHVSQRSQIDLVRLHDIPDTLFHQPHDIHHLHTVGFGKIRHFSDVIKSSQVIRMYRTSLPVAI